MTAEAALIDLACKIDPMTTHCLRCCCRTRVALSELAAYNMAGTEPYEVTDEAVDAEVARLFREHPGLSEKFRPHGCPLVTMPSCTGVES